MSKSRKQYTSSKRIAKKPYKLVGGPWDGETLYLTSPSTLAFEVNGQRGYYVGATPTSENYIHWNPL